MDAANVEANRVLGSVFAAVADNDAKDATMTPAEAARRAIDHLERGRRRGGGHRTRASTSRWPGSTSTRADPRRPRGCCDGCSIDEPDLPEAAVLLARAETALGHPDRAAAALEAAASGNPRLLASLAELYERQQRWTDAAATYEQLSALAPGSHDTRIRWASALLQIDTAEAFAQAREVLGPVLEAAPTEPRALYLLSTAERRAKDFAAAEATARRLIAAATAMRRAARSRSRRSTRTSGCSARRPTCCACRRRASARRPSRRASC